MISISIGKNSNKKKMETSKRVLWTDLALAVGITGAVIAGELTGHDMTATSVVAGLWDAQLGAVIGFYLWKAKNENRSKYAMQLVKDLEQKHGIESVARLAEVILRD